MLFLSVFRRENRPPSISGSALAELISLPEIVQDVCKWVVYDFLSSAAHGGDISFTAGYNLAYSYLDTDLIVPSAEHGLIAGIAGFTVFQLLNNSERLLPSYERAMKLLRSSVEGSVLFASYELTEHFFESSSLPIVRDLLVRRFSDFNGEVFRKIATELTTYTT